MEVSPITISVGVVVGVSGLLYFYRKSIKSYIINKVIEQISEKREETKFQPLRKTQSAMVLFEHGGKQHKLFVPYNRRKSSAMIKKKVYLIFVDREEEITHKPGIPYLLSAGDMGGDKIVVKIDNIVVKEYVGDEVPNYLD